MSKDPERIWLQNAEDASHTPEGRLWAEDKVWPDDPEDGEPVEYIRADLVSAALTEARREVLEEAAAAVRRIGSPAGAADGDTRIVGTSVDAEVAIRALMEKERIDAPA